MDSLVKSGLFIYFVVQKSSVERSNEAIYAVLQSFHFFHFSQFIFFLTVFERFACLCWHLPASKHIVHNNFFPSGCEHNVLLFLLYDAVDAVIFALFLFLFFCCCCDRIRCVVWWWQCLFLEWSVDYMYIYNESSFIANIVNCCI